MYLQTIYTGGQVIDVISSATKIDWKSPTPTSKRWQGVVIATVPSAQCLILITVDFGGNTADLRFSTAFRIPPLNTNLYLLGTGFYENNHNYSMAFYVSFQRSTVQFQVISCNATTISGFEQDIEQENPKVEYLGYMPLSR